MYLCNCSNCTCAYVWIEKKCLILVNVSTSECARIIFDFPVVLELVQLLVGIWVYSTLNFRFMFKNSDFLRGFFKGNITEIKLIKPAFLVESLPSTSCS